jgi:hypothetical protein
MGLIFLPVSGAGIKNHPPSASAAAPKTSTRFWWKAWISTVIHLARKGLEETLAVVAAERG